MKHIVVCVKMVPVETEAVVNSDLTMNRDRMTLQLNIADMAAVEAALRCKPDAAVTILSMGTEKGEELLRDLLAQGADRAILLTDKAMAGADAWATATVLKAALDMLAPTDLILCGRKTVDGETGQVPGELAAALDMPCITNVSAMAWEAGELRCIRLLETGTETLQVKLPAVISLCEYAYPLRLAGIRSRRQAAGKTVERLSVKELPLAADFSGREASRTKVIKALRPEAGLRLGPIEEDIDEGIKKLRLLVKEMGS